MFKKQTAAWQQGIMVGGIPLACKNWDGNSADTAIFKARSKALVSEFKKSETPK